MATQKNATYKVDNGTDFDEINFKTIAAQVKMASGVDLESGLLISKSANGYTKLPNGLIIQWGKIKGWNGGQIWVSFPITFPTLTLSVVITSMGSSAANNSVQSYLATGFNMNSSENNQDTFWIAIGY